MSEAKYELASCFHIISLIISYIVVPIALFVTPMLYISAAWLCVLAVMTLEGLWCLVGYRRNLSIAPL